MAVIEISFFQVLFPSKTYRMFLGDSWAKGALKSLPNLWMRRGLILIEVCYIQRLAQSSEQTSKISS